MQEVILDISVKPDADDIPKVHMKQGDTQRYFRAVIQDAGADYAIPDGTALTVWFAGTGGQGNYASVEEESAFSVSGDTVTVRVSPLLTAVKGGGVMCLVMTDADGLQLGTWDICYVVEGLPGADGADAADTFEAYRDLLAQAVAAAATFETDKTLSVSGMAADAEAAGDAIAAILKPGKKELFYSQTGAGGNRLTTGINAYPTAPGVYRVNTGSAAMGIPANYGTLVIFDGGSGYYMHLYIGSGNRFYYGRTTSLVAPTWYEAVDSDTLDALLG